MKNKSFRLAFRCPAREDSRLLAGSLAPFLEPGMLLSLEGSLGAGKTAFVEDLAGGAGFAPGTVSSPTFTIVQEYRSEEALYPIFHFDVYRLEDAKEFYAAGLEEYFTAGGVCLMEWAERVEDVLPSERIELTIEAEGPLNEEPLDFSRPLVLPEDRRSRLFFFETASPREEEALRAWRHAPGFPEDLLIREAAEGAPEA